MNESSLQVIGQCLKASVTGAFFPDWEFQTLFGLERSRVAEIARVWPKVDMHDDDVRLAVNGAMNNLLGNPHGCDSEWSKFISVSPQQLEELSKRWRLEAGAA